MIKSPSKAESLKLLDRICDQYEAQWQNGQRRSPLEFVDEIPEPWRDAAMRHLLRIEMECSNAQGLGRSLEDYLTAYPSHSRCVRDVFAEVQALLDTSAGFDTISVGSPSPLPQLPDFVLLEQIGAGGMGVVYKARQVSLDRTVAIKLIRTGEFASTEQIERFVSEAKAAAKIEHPGIVTIYEVGHHQEQYYFAMEYVDGRTLDEVLKHENLSTDQIVHYVGEICDAIDVAHKHGILHRDIKPANILIDATGGVRIMDFGLAKIIDGDASPTVSGQVIGTPSYMSPEQARGEITSIDRRSDVYSLGALLYWALCRKPPFEADSIAELIAMVIRDQPQPLSDVQPDIDPRFSELCRRCMEKSPEARFSTAGQLRDRLLEIHRSTRGGRDDFWSNRKTMPYLAYAAAGLLLVLAAAVIVIRFPGQTVSIQSPSDVNIAMDSNGVTVQSNQTKVVVSESDDTSNTTPSTEAISFWRDLHRSEIPEEQLSAAFGSDLSIVPRELVGLIQIPRSTGAAESMTGFEILPGGQKLVASTSAGSVILWDIESQKSVYTFQVRWTPRCLAVSPSGSRLVVGGHGIEIFDLKTGNAISLETALPVEQISNLKFSSDGKLLAMASKSKGIQIVSAINGKPVQSIERHGSEFDGGFQIAFTPTGSHIAVTHNRRSEIDFVNVKTGKTSRRIELDSWITAMDLSADGGLLFAQAGGDGRERKPVLIKVSSGDTLREFEVCDQGVISPDARRLATCMSHSVSLYALDRLANPQHIALPEKVSQIRFAPTGSHLLAATETGRLYVLSAETGNEK